MQKDRLDTEGMEQNADGAQTNLGANHLETRKTSQSVTQKAGWFGTLPAWLLILIGIMAGMMIGALIMRQRARAQEIIVSVNGTNIKNQAFFHRLQITEGVPTMRKMVEENLQLQFAQKKGLMPTDAQVEAEYVKISQKPGFEQFLASSGQTVEDVKQNLRLQIAKSAVLTQGITVSETEVRRYYQSQSDPKNPNALFYRPETVTLRAIQTGTQAEADKAIAELTAETPFQLVAAAYSQDASKSNGGQLNPLLLGRSPLRTAPALEQAVFNLKVGQRLGPVMFNNHWWIFQCVDKTAASSLPFASVRDQCVTGAKLHKGGPDNSQKVEAEFVAFQHSATMHAFWPQYQAAIAVH